MSYAFETQHLTQGYAGRTVIHDLSMRAPDAGVLAILGPNGAGKSTLLQTLATLKPPRSGILRIFGQDIRRDADVRMARRQIGFLPQHFGFFPAYTVEEFVWYCAWLRRVPRRNLDADVQAALQGVNLTQHARVPMRKLSGGMLRRAGIAQALVGDIRLIILDEPTVGLDPEQRLDFRRLIRTVSSTATVVLSTHLVEDVSALADTAWVLREGRVIFDGTPQALTAQANTAAPGDTPLEQGYTTILRQATR